MTAAITYNRLEDASIRERRSKSSFMVIGILTLTGTYVTDGEAMDLSGIFKDLQLVTFENKAGYIFEYDYTAKKVKAYYADYSASVDGALIEVANEANITAASGVKFMAVGF